VNTCNTAFIGVQHKGRVFHVLVTASAHGEEKVITSHFAHFGRVCCGVCTFTLTLTLTLPTPCLVCHCHCHCRSVIVVLSSMFGCEICAETAYVCDLPSHACLVAYHFSPLSFLPRCMECRRGLAMRFLSVRPSVRLSVRLSVCQTRAL